ncbi:NYN domain-containing protein [Patescibacteria group bacterium]|nr:NYN domain-containing protein [Patescibacteria group bacterium]
MVFVITAPALKIYVKTISLTVLKNIGFKLITKPLKIIAETDKIKGDSRKANFDVEIALDAYEIRDNYDTLILFSGDSDFDYLVQSLRQKGKRVIVISSKYHISKELIKSCNKYIDLKKIRSFIERINKQKGPSFSMGS